MCTFNRITATVAYIRPFFNAKPHESHISVVGTALESCMEGQDFESHCINLLLLLSCSLLMVRRFGGCSNPLDVLGALLSPAQTSWYQFQHGLVERACNIFMAQHSHCSHDRFCETHCNRCSQRHAVALRRQVGVESCRPAALYPEQLVAWFPGKRTESRDASPERQR